MQYLNEHTVLIQLLKINRLDSKIMGTMLSEGDSSVNFINLYHRFMFTLEAWFKSIDYYHNHLMNI